MLPNGAFTQQRHRKTPSDALSALLMHRGSYKSPEGPPIPAKDQSTSKSTQAPLGEIHHNLERPGPSSKPTGRQLMDRTRLLHKKSTSDIRINRQELDKNKGDVKTKSPKKTKSSRNLAGFWGKAKPTQDKDSQQEVKYKENEAPNSAVEPIISLPISAQFSSRQIAFGTKVVLNDTQTAEQQVRKNNSQSCPPTKTESLDNKHALARYEGIKVPLKDSVESKPIVSGRTFGLLRRSNSSKSIDSDNTKIATRGRDSRPVSRPATSEGVSDKVMGTTRGKSRVRAAVAAISGRNKDPAPVAKSTKANPVDVEKEFEDMLEARNIAPEVRGKMRALDHSIKADLLKQDLIKSNNTNTSQVEEVSSGSRASSRPGVRSRTNTTESVQQVKIVNTDNVEKKTRPRSFTGFTLSKGGSSPKKQKQSKVPNHSRGKSVDIPRSISTTSLVSIASPSNFNLFGKTPKYAVPDDFISYLRANLRPQIVEVGRIQKLRQLLRNETVAWVDEFITEGGMIELVNLIYRIIDIEWR